MMSGVNCNVPELHGTLSNDTKVYVRQVCGRAGSSAGGLFPEQNNLQKTPKREVGGGGWEGALILCGAQAASKNKANDPVLRARTLTRINAQACGSIRGSE